MAGDEQSGHEDVETPGEDARWHLRLAGFRATAHGRTFALFLSLLLGSVVLLSSAAPAGLGAGSAPDTVGSDANRRNDFGPSMAQVPRPAFDAVSAPAATQDGGGYRPRLVRDITAAPGEGSHPKGFADLGGALIFSADDRGVGAELWASNGTEAGTALLKDINPGQDGSDPSGDFAIADGVLYFTASDGEAGAELWRSDGTEAGTVRVKDINPGSDSSAAAHHTNVDGVVYFAADDGQTGRELWKTDGTADGTVLVLDIEPGLNGSHPAFLTAADGVLYFVAGSGADLWKTDGTASGTARVKDIRLGGRDSTRALTYVPGRGLFFSACDQEAGCELWRTDGTEAGTVRVKDIQAGRESGGAYVMRNVGGDVYFSADDGVHGTELWKTDGTSAGTVLVRDIDPGANDSHPFGLRDIDGVLYFTASDNAAGRELWRSDGTELGTVRVRDIHPGSGGSGDVPGNGPWGLTTVNGTLFFSACDGVSGCELWQTDGTEADTVQVMDIRPGTPGSGPSELTNVNGILFFAADDGTIGEELWMLDPSPPVLELPDGRLAEATGPDGAAVTYEAKARDNFDGPIVPECIPISGAMFALGTTTVMCTASDSSGNRATQAFTVTVQDTTSAVLEGPGNVVAEATEPSGAVVVYEVTATDAVDPSPDVECSPRSGSTFPLGPTLVTCSATDQSGNRATPLSLTVTVRDTTRPALTDPGHRMVEATGAAGAAVIYPVTATDAVDPAPVVTCSHPSGSTFPLGDTSVTCAARDFSGNEAAWTRTITVRDTTRPTLSLPGDLVGKATGPAGVVVTFEATAQDLVDPDPAVICQPASGSTFSVGATTITCTSTDDAGNAATGTFRVTIEAAEGVFVFGVFLDPLTFLLLTFAIAFVTSGVLGAAAVLRRRKRRGKLVAPKTGGSETEPGTGSLTPDSSDPRRKP